MLQVSDWVAHLRAPLPHEFHPASHFHILVAICLRVPCLRFGGLVVPLALLFAVFQAVPILACRLRIAECSLS